VSGALEELYQEVILDHGRRPRHFGRVPDANRRAEGFNPLCGDRLELTLRVEEDAEGSRVAQVAFTGEGCAISRASASLMAQAVRGRTSAEAEALFQQVHRLVTEGPEAVDLEALGKLAVLSGVRRFPTRVKCASLPWHALRAALSGQETAVSTEGEEDPLSP
jgi:nitrogen fixation protein NifU and related proteins